jgi:S-adenosylmethionine-dependent methyltransferase
VEHPRVVDVGGGSGGWAVPFAADGCLVTVVEPNPNALATLQRRAAEEGVSDRITVVADDSDALAAHVAAGSADLVLAHGLLEVVDDPAETVAALARAVAPDGAVSVLAANRHAAVIQRALAGKLAEARVLLTGPDGVLPDDGETLLRRFDGAGLVDLLAAAGLEVALLQGDSVVSDAVQGSVVDPDAVASWEHDLAEFEAAAAVSPPLRDVASRLHALARRAR